MAASAFHLLSHRPLLPQHQQRSLLSPSPRLLLNPLRLPCRSASRRRARAAASPPGVSHDAGATEVSRSEGVGQTASTDHHSELAQIGVIPSLKGSRVGQKVPYVIFCAPPYRSDDYPEDLRKRVQWQHQIGTEKALSCLHQVLPYMTAVTTDCATRSPRADVLLKAENVVLEAGGCVLRLVGLYKMDRGPHVFWLSKGTLDVHPDHIVSLIHYVDAASLAITIMRKSLRGRVFVACDNQPLSRQEIMDRVN